MLLLYGNVMENQQQQQNELNLGETLRQQRQQLGLTIEEVATKIHLRAAIIEHIENNELVLRACPPAFMKGYVRNYAKFLKVPESIWNNPAISYGEAIQNDLQKNIRNNRKVNHYSSYSNWIGRLTWLVALIMIGMTAYWWWQNYQQSQNERTSLVENFLKSSQNDTSTSDGVQTGGVIDVNNLTSTATTANTTPAENENNLAATPAATEPTTSLTPAQTEIQAPANSQSVNANETTIPYQAQTSGQVLSDAMEQLDGTTTAGTANDQSAVDDGAPAITGNGLTIEIVGNSCWLSVRDTNNKVLAQKEYKQGEVLTFNDGEPYSLVIGAPQNVRITFQGQEVPLTIDGRVARIKLPN